MQKRQKVKWDEEEEKKEKQMKKEWKTNEKQSKAKRDEEEEKKDKQTKERMKKNGLNELASIWVWDNIDGNTDNSLNLTFKRESDPHICQKRVLINSSKDSILMSPFQKSVFGMSNVNKLIKD